MKRLAVYAAVFFICLGTFSAKAQIATVIRLNQIGFYPYAHKEAVFLNQQSGKFDVVEAESKKVVFSATFSKEYSSDFSPTKTRIADFSRFKVPGTYMLTADGKIFSQSFTIGQDVFKKLSAAVVKAFYYQRASMPLEEKYAGKWHRSAGHPDNQVYIHASAASSARPAGTVITAPGGWYDAGDYNKYVVNSGISVATLLSAYEDFPGYYADLHLNIPESGNKVPDILNETLYNIRWMLYMQDNDGGVYNKVTNVEFDAMEMPDQALAKRYVVQKGTAATLDFAAVMAQAARLYKHFNSSFSGLSDSCLTAAIRAWKWANQHPEMVYDQTQMNTRFAPKINTGGYGDREFNDEFSWAGCELYLTTADTQYYNNKVSVSRSSFQLPAWSQVRLLGYYSLLRSEGKLKGKAKIDLPVIKKRLLRFADSLAAGVDDRYYHTVIGRTKSDFNWGSNSTAANQGIALIQAWKISKDSKYLDAALTNLDYLLGRNATGYSYVTGFGIKTPMNPHQRTSVADGIKDPIPGFLVGGPNRGMQDKCAGYSSAVPDEAYADESCAYASNEVAINWNASMVYLVGAIQALQQKFNTD